MISQKVVDEVRRLLSEGNLSQRKIARQTGISRATVGAIAHGKRPDYPDHPLQEWLIDRPSGLPRRCPGCGGMVYLPCLLCRVRNEKDSRRRRRKILRRVLNEGPW